LLRPYYAKPMKAMKIGPKIGNVKYDEVNLIETV